VREFFDPISAFCVAINAIDYGMHSSRSHDAVIRVYDDAASVIEKHEYANDSNKHAALPEFGQLGDSKIVGFSYGFTKFPPIHSYVASWLTRYNLCCHIWHEVVETLTRLSNSYGGLLRSTC